MLQKTPWGIVPDCAQKSKFEKHWKGLDEIWYGMSTSNLPDKFYFHADWHVRLDNLESHKSDGSCISLNILIGIA